MAELAEVHNCGRILSYEYYPKTCPDSLQENTKIPVMTFGV